MFESNSFVIVIKNKQKHIMNVIYSGQFAGFISIINQTIKIKTTSTSITSYIRIVQCSILYKNILMIIFL